MVKRINYDIVFMDHMMPEMDGIEATAAIRAWEKESKKNGVPIIALTANAMSGMKEMFIEKGFNDFLAKPIDIGKMDDMLGRWIPKEKRESGKGERKPPEDEKKFIVLVDDNPANLRMGKNILSEKYRVATAPSAEKLFGLLESNRPMLILMDVDMPVMNGYEALDVLKSKEETKDIPVIFLAENSMDREKGLGMGAADFISKSFDSPAALMTSVEEHL
jgi:CheY-like chemotaxis protein